MPCLLRVRVQPGDTRTLPLRIRRGRPPGSCDDGPRVEQYVTEPVGAAKKIIADRTETQERAEALDSRSRRRGQNVRTICWKDWETRRSGAYLPYSATTAYINTIPSGKEDRSPGNHALEHRIRSYVRWNSMAMVLRANKNSNVGGHIASFASAATFYDVGSFISGMPPAITMAGDTDIRAGTFFARSLCLCFPAGGVDAGNVV